jgi:hypothetical protein
MTKKHFIRLAAAFNAMVRAAEIDNAQLDRKQKEIIFSQLALACSDLGPSFSYATFEDACGMAN